MSFIPDDIGQRDEFATCFAQREGFRIGDDVKLPELRGTIDMSGPAELIHKLYDGEQFVACDAKHPKARLYVRIAIDVDGHGRHTLDVPPSSHRALRTFVDQHTNERVRITTEVAGRGFVLRLEPDDGQPMAEPVRHF